MITLNEYINEGLQRQVVRNSIVNRRSSSSNSKSLNNNDNKKLQFKDYDIEIVDNDNLRQ